jgi:hypothetical protein
LNAILYLIKENSGKWPCVSASIEYIEPIAEEDSKKQDQFSQDLCGLFDQLQDAFDRLTDYEKKRCGKWGVAVEITIEVDASNKKILLDRLFKYCNLDFHLFTALLEMLRRNFPDYDLVVPTLEGYELAKEICQYLGVPEIEFIHLKRKDNERLLSGKTNPEITFEGILEDTKKHYNDSGSLEKKRQESGSGMDIAMYYDGAESEEEVLWMQVRIPISGNLKN